MMQLVNINDLTVVKNITPEQYFGDIRTIENVVNELISDILHEKGMIDIDDRTLVRVIRRNDDLIVSVDDMITNRYYKEQKLDGWY